MLKLRLKEIRSFLHREARGLPSPRFPAGRRILPSDIRLILPHRDAMLLLDEVDIQGNKIIGTLEVTRARCVSFCFDDRENSVMRGTDLIDMAAQLLGMYGSLFPELARMRRRFVLATTGVAKFHAPIIEGETVKMSILIDNITAKKMLRTQRDQYLLRGRRFVVSVDGETKAEIGSVLIISTPLKEEECQTDFEKRQRH